jgi:hypothetical protein
LIKHGLGSEVGGGTTWHVDLKGGGIDRSISLLPAILRWTMLAMCCAKKTKLKGPFNLFSFKLI